MSAMQAPYPLLLDPVNATLEPFIWRVYFYDRRVWSPQWASALVFWLTMEFLYLSLPVCNQCKIHF
jgi:hypothetical protein